MWVLLEESRSESTHQLGYICCCYCYNFVTMQANIQTKHAQQMEGHSTLRNKCICCFQVVHILARRTAPPSSRAPRHRVPVRQGFIPFLHQPFDINNILRGLDNPSRPRPCCTLACRCGRGPTQGTCKRELTAEGLLPSIRMRVRILFVAYDDTSQKSGRKQAHF